MHVDIIRDALHRQPFEPFHLRTVDGRLIPVPHPDWIAVTPRRVLVVSQQDESVTWLEPILIQSIEFPAGKPSGAGGSATDNGA